MDNEDKESKEENEIYLYFRKKLDSIKEENERILGRNTLVVAGGAFTLSVTLLKDLYPHPLPWSRYFLVFFMDRFRIVRLFADLFRPPQQQSG